MTKVIMCGCNGHMGQVITDICKADPTVEIVAGIDKYDGIKNEYPVFAAIKVGINLLREGLDIPEITLVAILDADKEGFLRSETSLIQTIGRAARNAEGHVIMYADTVTDSMRVAIEETKRRRKIQQEYNEAHGITPKTIQKSVRDLISISKKVAQESMNFEKDPESMNRKELEKLVKDVTKKMQKAAAELNFEAAAQLRDQMIELKNMLRDL